MADTLLAPKATERPKEFKAAGQVPLTKLEAHLLGRNSPTYNAYYNGKMSYTLHGTAWADYVANAYPDLKSQNTSENIFKTVIDMYAENLTPVPDELRGFSNSVVPLLSRGECVVVVDSAGTPHFPEQFEMISDGKYTIAAIFTRSLSKMEDYITFVSSDGVSRLFSKRIPDDFSPATHNEGFTFVEEKPGNTLFRFALDDKGFGASLAALQDRLNHSIVDQTIVAEMYARPFWYLMNVQIPPVNPFLPNQPESDAMVEHKNKDTGSGRIFTTSSEGPFGQLDPPTIGDMIGYHDSIMDKISTSTGIPQHYFKPGSGVPPTGVALKVLSKRYNNKVSRMRQDIEPLLEELATLLGIEKTAEAKDANGNDIKEFQFWPEGDDLLQEALDAHGIALSQMGYPLKYIAEVVTPGVDLDDYEDDTLDEPGVNPADLGQPTDMTATGQQGLSATPGQVQAYATNPGQRQKVRN